MALPSCPACMHLSLHALTHHSPRRVMAAPAPYLLLRGRTDMGPTRGQ